MMPKKHYQLKKQIKKGKPRKRTLLAIYLDSKGRTYFGSAFVFFAYRNKFHQLD
jgi:hypothetical protein